jgi:tryptophan synthase beta chain
LDAFGLLSAEEGILPALETSHGLAHGFKRAQELHKDQIICINLSGRGDKDAMEVARLMNVPGLPQPKVS